MNRLLKNKSIAICILGLIVTSLGILITNWNVNSFILIFGLALIIASFLKISSSAISIISRSVNIGRRNEQKLARLQNKLIEESVLARENAVFNKNVDFRTRTILRINMEQERLAAEVPAIDQSLFESRNAFMIEALIELAGSVEALSVFAKGTLWARLDELGNTSVGLLKQQDFVVESSNMKFEVGHAFANLVEELGALTERFAVAEERSEFAQIETWQNTHRALLHSLDLLPIVVAHKNYLQTSKSIMSRNMEWLNISSSPCDGMLLRGISESVFFGMQQEASLPQKVLILCETVEEQELATGLAQVFGLEHRLFAVRMSEVGQSLVTHALSTANPEPLALDLEFPVPLFAASNDKGRG